MKCSICELPIRKGEPTKKTGDYEAHKLCFDIAVANLVSELEACMLASPDKYELLPNGNFRSVEKP